MVPLPSVVPPALNVTVPVGVPRPVMLGPTVAVRTTDWPTVEGLIDDVKLIVDAALLTVCASGAELLPLKFVSPAYAAISEWLPGLRNVTVNVAVPLLMVPLP